MTHHRVLHNANGALLKGFLFAISAWSTCLSIGYADCPAVTPPSNATDQKISTGVVAADTSCIEGDPNGGACNAFVGMVIDKTYAIPDFQTPGGYLNSAGMFGYVSTHPQWTLVGNGDGGDQTALTQAQTDANNGIAVIALTGGHVALIIPSPVLIPSPSGGVCVPLSAAHFLNKPAANYTSGPLSKSWTSPKGVTLYEHP